jgi:hypothetical protein
MGVVSKGNKMNKLDENMLNKILVALEKSLVKDGHKVSKQQLEVFRNSIKNQLENLSDEQRNQFIGMLSSRL